MLKALWTLAALLPDLAQAQRSTIERAHRELEAAAMQGYPAVEKVVLARFDPGYTYTGPDKQTLTRAQVLAQLKRDLTSGASIKLFKFTLGPITQRGGKATLPVRMRIEMHVPAGPTTQAFDAVHDEKMVETWVRSAGSWKLKSAISKVQIIR